jgi:hypothetical protein
MKKTMRAGIVASLVLTATVAFARDDAYDQKEASTATDAKDAPSTAMEGPGARRTSSASDEAVAVKEASPAGSDGRAASQGAASAEPGDAGAEEERAHQAWVESIWNSP